MKITITGSLGNVGRPLTQKLVEAGHQVTVISHSKDRKADIEAMGAKPAIGSVTDAAFLTQAFTGADAVFAMTPPAAGVSNIVDNTISVGKALATAIKQAHTPRVVMLSSMGADVPDKNGPIRALYNIEKMYSEIEDTAFVFLRSGSFYLNFFQNIPMIKNMGILGSNLPENMKFMLGHPADIATAAARILQSSFTGKQVRYIVSDIRTPKEIAKALGTAIGKPELKWVEFTDEQSLQGMKQGGLPEELAALFTEMNAGYRSGRLFIDFENNGSPVDGKIKLEDFAKDFAGKFNKQPVPVG
jgi:uncharacterized protein YbjT (DUF2867 family)